jgi:hypothetical protein
MNISITESDFNWFIDSFYHTSLRMERDKKGFIKASEFKRVASSSKNLNTGQYRQLMKLAVDKDYATDNDNSPNNCKYAIRFNSSPVPVRLFDKDLLADRVLKFLPPLYLLEVNSDTGEITDGEDWKIHNIYWSSIIGSLIVHENTGEFKTNFSSRDEQFFIVGLKKWVYVYEILKYGWNEIAWADPFKKENYNDCFKCILMCASESHWRNRHKNLINRPVTQRKRLDSIKSNGINRQDVDRLRHGMAWNRDDIAGIYAALNWLKEAAKQSQDPHVKSALSRLKEIDKEIEMGVYTIVRRQENRTKNNT